MGRIRVFAVVLALGSLILGPLPADAGSTWDVNDEDRAISPGAVHASSASAFGYVDKGLDPDDRQLHGFDPDIRSSVRRVWADRASQRWLSVSFHANEPLGGYWSVIVRLDSQGGRFVDYWMTIYDDGLGQSGCYLGSHKRRSGIYHAPTFGDRARCRVPLRWVTPSKHIRWRLFSPKNVESPGGNDEYAPDRGWYPSH